MTSSTTTPDSGSEPQMGTLLRIGLTTGQTLIALTAQETETDLDLLVIHAENGDRIEVRKDFITYVRGTEVPVPTEEEVAEYEASLKAETTGNNINVHSVDDVQAAISRIQQSPYL